MAGNHTYTTLMTSARHAAPEGGKWQLLENFNYRPADKDDRICRLEAWLKPKKWLPTKEHFSEGGPAKVKTLHPCSSSVVYEYT